MLAPKTMGDPEGVGMPSKFRPAQLVPAWLPSILCGHCGRRYPVSLQANGHDVITPASVMPSLPSSRCEACQPSSSPATMHHERCWSSYTQRLGSSASNVPRIALCTRARPRQPEGRRLAKPFTSARASPSMRANPMGSAFAALRMVGQDPETRSVLIALGQTRPILTLAPERVLRARPGIAAGAGGRQHLANTFEWAYLLLSTFGRTTGPLRLR